MAQQIGMQMPAARAGRAPTANVYTVLLAVATVGLGAAVFFVYQAALAVAPAGDGPAAVFELHSADPGAAGLQLNTTR